MNHAFRIGLFGFALITALMATWLLVFLPVHTMRRVQEEIFIRTGRVLNVSDGASMQFTPQLGIAIHGIILSGAPTSTDPIIKAQTLLVPATLAQIMGMQTSNPEIELDEPVVTLSFNAEGRSNILGSDEASNHKTDSNVTLPTPFRAIFKNGTFVFNNTQKGNSFSVDALEGVLEADAQGETTLKAAMTVAGERTHVTAQLKSLVRAFGDGSPIDFNIDAVGASLGFSGRIVCAQGVDLAGQGTIDADDTARFLKWVGVNLRGLNSKTPMTLTGAVDSASSVFSIKQSEIRFAGMSARGDISFSNSGVRPKARLSLKADFLNTEFYNHSPPDSASTGSWNDQAFNLNDLSAFDLAFDVLTPRFRHGTFETTDAKIGGVLSNGVLSAEIDGTNLGQVKLNFDGQQTDPKLDLELALVLSDAKTFIEQFTAMHWLSGALTVNGKLRAAGTSQSAMIGALNGHIELHSSEAAFKGVDLAAIAEQALAAPLVNWQGSKTDPVSFDASFELSDGVAALQDNNLSAPGLKMVTSGEIDVLRQALALTALVNLNRGNDKPLRIAVKGPWSKPQLNIIK